MVDSKDASTEAPLVATMGSKSAVLLVSSKVETLVDVKDVSSVDTSELSSVVKTEVRLVVSKASLMVSK